MISYNGGDIPKCEFIYLHPIDGAEVLIWDRWCADIDWSVTSKIDENGYEVEGGDEKGAIKA